MDRPQFEAIKGFDERLVSWGVSDFMFRLLMSTQQAMLLDGIYLNVYETAGSQSTLTHGSPGYLRLFAHKLDAMGDVPESERNAPVRQLRALILALWDAGAIHEFKAVSLRAAPLLRQYAQGGKLQLAAHLPAFALRTLRHLPGLG